MSLKVYKRRYRKLNNYCCEMKNLICNENNKAFSRHRKITINELLIQMLSQKGRTQREEVLSLFAALKRNDSMSDIGFFKARMKFNPEAIREISQRFIVDEIKEHKSHLKTFKNYYVYAFDGTSITVPSNMKFDKIQKKNVVGKKGITNMPQIIKASALADVLNHLLIKIEIAEYDHDERDHAITILNSLNTNNINKAIFTYDRGYFSYELLNIMDDLGANYVFRLSKYALSKYQKLMEDAKLNDENYYMTLNKSNLNGIRNNEKLRNSILAKTYKIRICRIKLKDEDEWLVTNLPENKISLKEMANLYHLRWDIETAFRDIKKAFKVEEFSGRRERLVLQDIYAAMLVFNMTNLLISRRRKLIDQKKYKHIMDINKNVATGIVKKYLIISLFESNDKKRKRSWKCIDTNIIKYLCPKRPNRTYSREHKPVNHSSMSYRLNY